MDLGSVATAGAPAAIGPYAQAVRCGGLLFCSGQIGMDPASKSLAPGGISAETERALRNLRAVLEAGGSSLGLVARTTVYLTDMNEFAAMNRVYESAFGAHRPARATVGVAALPKGARVEIECVAAIPAAEGAR